MTVTEIELGPGESPEPLRPSPRPGESLTAAAHRITKRQISRRQRGASAEDWQSEAWDMYDLVGEQHFLANTLAGRMGQARLYVGRLPEDSTEDIEALDDGPAVEVFQSLAGHGPGFSQKIVKMGLNLFMAGDCYLLGALPIEPSETVDVDPSTTITPTIDSTADVALEDLDWTVYSTEEVKFTQEGSIKVQTPSGDNVEHGLDDVFLLRVWRPHPRRWWEADSATRACLPILRELVGLTMHISAQTDSRLAGAGILFIPEEADRAVRAAEGQVDTDGESPLAAALMEAMITPISDRSSASAIVPVMPTVPGDSIEKFRHLSLASTLDSEARSLRDEAIRRLALSQDCPPEILLGVGGMNHWGAWLVREDVVTTHLEPPLALICDALTSQYLHPVLEQLGIEDARDYVIWYDVSDMIMRPDRSSNAKDLHAQGVISDEALREATGFDETAAPVDVGPTDPALDIVLDMVKQAPSLAQAPGLPALLAQVRAMLADEETVPAPAPAPEEIPPQSVPETGPPQTQEEAPPVEEGLAASAEPVSVTPSKVRMLPGLRSAQNFAQADDENDSEGDDDDDQ